MANSKVKGRLLKKFE